VLRDEYQEYCRRVLRGEDTQGFGSLMSKLQLALAPDGYTNEEVVKYVISLHQDPPTVSDLLCGCFRQTSNAAAKRKEKKMKRLQAEAEVS
jgi:hypothetical protein